MLIHIFKDLQTSFSTTATMTMKREKNELMFIVGGVAAVKNMNIDKIFLTFNYFPLI